MTSTRTMNVVLKNVLLMMVCCFCCTTLVRLVDAFSPKQSSLLNSNQKPFGPMIGYSDNRVSSSSTSSSSALYAIGVLAKKAKLASLRDYIQTNGIDPTIQEYITIIQQNAKEQQKNNESSTRPIGPVQQSLMKRKGTLTIIGEYKRKLSNGNTISDIYGQDPSVLSAMLRDYGATAIAVLADDKMGGCTVADLDIIVEEQRRAMNNVPGPIYVINNDLIVDAYQIAQTAAAKAHACVIQYSLVSENEFTQLLQAAQACQLEVIVAVSTNAEARAAIQAGATMISVINTDTIDERVQVLEGLISTDDTNNNICFICNIGPRNNNNLLEIEEAWAVRDKGYHCVWVGEVLYKNSALADQRMEHPGAIIKSMKSKSSLKWGTPQANAGRGEGAREYLGDIMM